MRLRPGPCLFALLLLSRAGLHAETWPAVLDFGWEPEARYCPDAAAGDPAFESNQGACNASFAFAAKHLIECSLWYATAGGAPQEDCRSSYGPVSVLDLLLQGGAAATPLCCEATGASVGAALIYARDLGVRAENDCSSAPLFALDGCHQTASSGCTSLSADPTYIGCADAYTGCGHTCAEAYASDPDAYVEGDPSTLLAPPTFPSALKWLALGATPGHPPWNPAPTCSSAPNRFEVADVDNLGAVKATPKVLGPILAGNRPVAVRLRVEKPGEFFDAFRQDPDLWCTTNWAPAALAGSCDSAADTVPIWLTLVAYGERGEGTETEKFYLARGSFGVGWGCQGYAALDAALVTDCADQAYALKAGVDGRPGQWLDCDKDGVAIPLDNCPITYNPDQTNTDYETGISPDNQGNACDEDDDGDGVKDESDNCPLVSNPVQKDDDHDGVGDKCQKDEDGDGWADKVEDMRCAGKTLPPTCPLASLCADVNPGATERCDAYNWNCDDQDDKDEGFLDSDGDGRADDCTDDDDDNDGVKDTADNCPLVANPDQANYDGEGPGDACAEDSDGDGDPDFNDCSPTDKTVHHGNVEACNQKDDDCNGFIDEGCADTDGDGIPDERDNDQDGDGFPHGEDCNDLDRNIRPGAYERCDGIDNNCDGKIDYNPDIASTDDQNNATGAELEGGDGIPDCYMQGGSKTGTPPPTKSTWADWTEDEDADGVADQFDFDDDDPKRFPIFIGTNPNKPPCEAGQYSTCKKAPCNECYGEPCDGVDNNNNGVTDEGHADSDGDGLADCLDTDDDNDGDPDKEDCAPLDPLVRKGVAEKCDLVDNDCNGITDDGSTYEGFVDSADSDPFLDCMDSNDDDDRIPDNGDGNPEVYLPCQDGVTTNCDDNCRLVDNDDQANLDGDDYGDVCDGDVDGDGVGDKFLTAGEPMDNCPRTWNPDQINTDEALQALGWPVPADGNGDACDDDVDNDGAPDKNVPADRTPDNCPLVPNPNQSDSDHDGVGDLCDADDDNDGVADWADNCPWRANHEQADLDHNGHGDACDDDTDGDGIPDDGDASGAVGDAPCGDRLTQACDDNCPRTYNPGQEDSDADEQDEHEEGADGVGNRCDDDHDNDGILNDADTCPWASGQAVDLDGDGVWDACDPDMDDDWIPNGLDNCPRTPNQDQANHDTDTWGDACDDDDDNDGTVDLADPCPLVAPEWFDDSLTQAQHVDTDRDGFGNECDWDDDGDGLADDFESHLGTHPLLADSDGDGFSDLDELRRDEATDPLRGDDYPGHRRPKYGSFSGGSGNQCALAGGFGSASAHGLPTLLLLGLVGAWLGARRLRARPRAGLLAALLTLGLPGPAGAMPLAPHLDLPTLGPFARVQTAMTGNEGERHLFQILYDYASSPLAVKRLGVVQDEVIRSENRLAVVGNAPLIGSQMAAWGDSRANVSLVLRLAWTLSRETGELYQEYRNGGVEDVLLALPIGVLVSGTRTEHAFVFEPYFTVPTGDEQTFTGHSRGAAGIVMGHDVEAGWFRLAYNLGIEYQPEGIYYPERLLIGRYMIAAAARLADRVLSLGLEYDGAVTFGRRDDLASLSGILTVELDHVQLKVYGGSDFNGFLGDSPFRLGVTLGLLY